MRTGSMSLRIAALLAICQVGLPTPPAAAAVRWFHETAVYFDVWDKEKAACEVSYREALESAPSRADDVARRAVLRDAKAARKACRCEGKKKAHEAYLKARDARWAAIVEARKKKP